MSSNVINFHIARAQHYDRRAGQGSAKEHERAAFEISEHDGEFYFHGFDRPFSRAELGLIAAQCEARGTGRVELGVLAEVIGRLLTPTQMIELAEMVRARGLEVFR